MKKSHKNTSRRQSSDLPDRRARKAATRAARQAGPGGPSAETLYRRLQDPGARLDGFTCGNCGVAVPWEGAGSAHRNHCPRCLYSRHLDDEPGDRASECLALMEPVAVWVRKGGEWAVIHRCRECGVLSSNRVAADDNVPLLVSLAMRPIASPPFPLTHEEP